MPRNMTDRNAGAAFDAGAIADFLLDECRERGEILSNLKLQKLLFYADAWSMALFGSPLFNEDFEAWVHGPVLPSQYRRFREHRWRPITTEVVRPKLPTATVDHLIEIIEVFGVETAVALELMTHREKPWMDARGDLAPSAPCTNVISKSVTMEYYKSLQ